ncbi:MAG: aminotransferase class III-fold pyridoxal phosphate-dependent enzyme [Gammaproteobacteria bacterium]|nr:aminotransferase class III-fold pyridoxal phosphate-dependent enzyme [Gammaproteobacteria bacterium]
MSTGPDSTFGVRYLEHNLPSLVAGTSTRSVRIMVENQGQHTWRRYHPEGRCIDLVVYIDGILNGTHPLPRDEILPGEQASFHFALDVPQVAGRYDIVIDLIEQNVAQFADKGIQPLRHTMIVTTDGASYSTVLQQRANRLCPWYYRPSGGIEFAADGSAFPLFVSKAKGCRIWDTENRSYIDYVMGWGSALLGYAEPRIQDAVRECLDSGAIVPLPHALEIEVAQILTEDIPSAERVMFGKNGSDVCTLAARLARAFTGRKIILFSGYHGWQDWWVEHIGFTNTGVPERSEPLTHRFRFNDLEDFLQLYARHKGDLAAVMLEPAGPAEGPQGFSRDADADFLRTIAAATRSTGALLIYDEIMTGFRYLGGSVQAATGIVPDITCLGKALSGGMPLSALVGRADIFERAMHRTHYGPTFRGEIYSLAAAKAALQIYREESVAEHIWHHGEQIKQGIAHLCMETGVTAECAGPPFRMNLVFRGDDADRLRLKRTLYFQELLKAGVVTYHGFMIPSYAHDDCILQALLQAAGRALEKVATAEKQGNLDRLIEIPLV